MKQLLAALGILVLLGILASIGSSGSDGRVGAASYSAPHDPPKFTSMSLLLSSDAAKISADRALADADAKNGQNGPSGSGCYNLLNNVTPDARAIGTFVVNDVGNDVNNLQKDINTLERDINSFNEDIADFTNDGVPKPTGATVSRVKAAIAAEIKSANSMIAAMQDNVDTAYSDGNNLAYGTCHNDGPGKAPEIPTVTS
jgi:hypothetical protein